MDRRGTRWWVQWVIAGVLLAPLPAAAAAAPDSDPVCHGDPTPLLRLTAHFSALHANQASTYALVVCRGGQALTATTGWLLSSDVPSDAQVASGPLAAADFSRLLDELSAARIGAAQDCDWYPGCCLISAELRLTWYGRARRTHSFVTRGDSNLPRCSPEINTLIEDALTLAIPPPGPAGNR